MVLPCKHQEQVTKQIQPTIDLLNNMDEWHPDVLLEHGIQPADYRDALVFRSASEPAKEARQLYLFDEAELTTELDARLWHGSFNSRESTLQQLSPYVGKMKSGMARALIKLYSKPGDTVLDPFSGSGVVPLEAALAGRCAWANVFW